MTYKLTQIPTLVQGGRMELSILVFVLLRQSEINLRCLDSPQLALQEYIIFLVMTSYDVFDPPS